MRWGGLAGESGHKNVPVEATTVKNRGGPRATFREALAPTEGRLGLVPG